MSGRDAPGGRPTMPLGLKSQPMGRAITTWISLRSLRLLAALMLAPLLVPQAPAQDEAQPPVPMVAPDRPEAEVTPSPTPTPKPTPSPTPDPNKIDIELTPEQDPNAPGLSREERFRRQRELIRRQLKAWEERQELIKKGLWPPKPTPTPTPKPGDVTTTRTAATTETEKAELTLDISEAARIPFVTFYMDPGSNNVRVGEQFATTCRLLNPDHLPIDRIAVRLDYPEAHIEPVSVHQDRLLALIEGDPELVHDAEDGTLEYVARLETRNLVELELITIVWRAHTPIQAAEIFPVIGRDGYSSAYYGRRILTKSVLGISEALAGASVRVFAADDAMPRGDRFLGDTFDSLAPVLSGFPDQRKLRPPRLWIEQPREGRLEPDQWLVVDFGLHNPDGMVFDEVRLALTFDPGDIEVMDADRRNWIGQGVNVLDGPFRGLWSWDTHYENRVDNQRGLIYYRMGLTTLGQQPEGPVARAFVRVKRATEGPLFEWVWNPGAPADRPQTGVFLLGENIYLRGREQPDHELWIGADGQMRGRLVEPGEKADPALYRVPRPDQP